MNILNITNGDCAVNIMHQARVPGVFLPWRDVLHSGPVPEGLVLDELSKIRAQFIAECGWAKREEVLNGFIARDLQLKACNQYDKVILWFEHDLYDQLQLLQILDWLQQNPAPDTELVIICTDQYLGMQTPEELFALKKYQRPITAEQLMLATQAWAAFRSSTPVKWSELLSSDTAVLPFLQAAVLRQLEEYPSTLNGLSRTAHMALEIISRLEKKPEEIFSLYQQTEDRRFLGDSGFWLILEQLLNSSPPLIVLKNGTDLRQPSSLGQTLRITSFGSDVLIGQKNWLDIAPLDHWIGGVHLNSENIWLWDSDSAQLYQ